MTVKIENTLRRISIFVDLPDTLLSGIAAAAKTQYAPAGTVLSSEKDTITAFYLLLSGQLEVFIGGQNEAVVTQPHLLEEGEYFGETALLSEQTQTATIRARRDSQVLVLEKKALQAMAIEHPELKAHLDQLAAARLGGPVEIGHHSSRIFISYSRKDKEFVQKQHDSVKQHNIEPWVDWENIPLTSNWWEEIVLGIQNADAFAFVITPDSLNSPICHKEIETALQNQKRLVPILHREQKPGDPIHQALSEHNWVFMRNDQEIVEKIPEMIKVINTDLKWVRAHTRLLQWSAEKGQGLYQPRPALALDGCSQSAQRRSLCPASRAQEQSGFYSVFRVPSGGTVSHAENRTGLGQCFVSQKPR